MRFALLLLLIVTAPLSALGQDRSNTILVLDGSGSMWGQIDGINKIVIARDVVGDLLQDFPEDQNLGLTVYGHRTRGDCSDIETVVMPGADTTDTIAAAVEGINPRGMTPMTDAIIAAANSLRYTEQKATVILVSDGVETCNPDPCAAAAALEEAGIDFTAHVIGFDVADPEALRQMQCLAENTGGTFNTASNASELSSALTVAVAEPEPEPEPVLGTVRFSARIGTEDGALIDGPIEWEVAGESEVAPGIGNPYVVDIAQGSYEVTAYWLEAEIGSEPRQFIATPQGREIVVVFEEPAATATLTAPDSAVQGDTIEVAWTGPAEADDFIAVRSPDRTDYHRFINSAEVSDGNPVTLLMPVPVGNYAIEYIDAESRTALASETISITPVDVSLTAPAEGTAGDSVEVAWSGPDYANDFIAIRAPDSEGFHRFINTTGTSEGSPLVLQLPPHAGDYVIEYIINQDRSPLAVSEISVTDVAAQIAAPAAAVAGQTLEIAWTGPAYANDFIAVRSPNSEGFHRFINSTPASDGSPLNLLMPAQPGDYVIEYIEAQGRSPLAAAQISLSAIEASLAAPGEAAVGSTIEVAWTGPDYRNDFIAIRSPDSEGFHRFATSADTSGGSPVTLAVPTQPGNYVIEYIVNQDRSPAATAPLVVRPVDVSLVGPTEAEAASTIEVAWTGPKADGNFIGIGPVGSTNSDRWRSYSYTTDGNPARMIVPAAPGDYEIRFFLDRDNTPVGDPIPLRVSTPTAGVVAPAEATAGATLEIGWTGPDHDGDFIGIGPKSATGSDRWTVYAYTRDGNPARIVLPEDPGQYTVRYFLDLENTPIYEQDIELR